VTPPPASSFEKLLAAMVVGIVGVSVVAFFTVIIGTAVGMGADDFAQGLWPVVAMLPLIGLPIGFVMIMVLLFVSTKRRRQGGTGASPR
jgi:uncharacterized membrane protein